MPTAGANYAAIKGQLLTDVKAAWPKTKAVHFGKPRKAKTSADLPFVVVRLPRLANNFGGEFSTVRCPEQPWSMEVEYVYEKSPVNESPLDVKVELGDALSVLIEAATTYAGVMMDPVVSQFDYEDGPEAFEGAESVTVTVEGTTRQDWGT